jgi:hypothetical protein
MAEKSRASSLSFAPLSPRLIDMLNQLICALHLRETRKPLLEIADRLDALGVSQRLEWDRRPEIIHRHWRTGFTHGTGDDVDGKFLLGNALPISIQLQPFIDILGQTQHKSHSPTSNLCPVYHIAPASKSAIRNPQSKGRADMLAMLFYADWDTDDEQTSPSSPSRAAQLRSEMAGW